VPNESGFWSQDVRPALLAYGIAKRIENILDLGTPDVAYALRMGVRSATGFIELKDLDGWPERAATKVQIPKYTVDQRKWHRDWGAHDHRIFLFVRVQGRKVGYDADLNPQGAKTEDEFFLFHAVDAADGIGQWTRAEWGRHAVYCARGSIDARRVASILVG
jgi:hypothetical protein